MPGAQCQLEQLIALRLRARGALLARLQNVSLQGSGAHRSPQRGPGIEFDSLRPYQAGDDLRTIDWRITARSQKPFTRLFHSERERPVLLWIDQRPSLHFGSRHAFKAVQAVEAASLIGWSALEQGDRIGALLGNGGTLCWHPAQRGQRAYLQLLKRCCDLNRAPQPDTPTPLAADFQQLIKRATPGSSLVLASDFATLTEKEVEQLQQLGQKFQMIALVLFDPLEFEPPQPGRYWLEQSGQRQQLDCQSERGRSRYRQQGLERQQWLNQQFYRCRIASHWISTATAVHGQLANAGGKR